MHESVISSEESVIVIGKYLHVHTRAIFAEYCVEKRGYLLLVPRLSGGFDWRYKF